MEGKDDGDLARHLRRTIDLLAQIPKLPDIDPMLQNTAKTASNIMDCPPISELTRYGLFLREIHIFHMLFLEGERFPRYLLFNLQSNLTHE